jgi:hypothetical protein
MTTTLDLQVSPRLKRPGCRRRDFDALDARACADNGPRSPADGSFQSRAPYLIEPHVQLRHTATTVTFDSSVLFSDRVG